MDIKTITIDCQKSKKIPGYEFSSQRYGISVTYDNIPEGFNQFDAEKHIHSINEFLSAIINTRLQIQEKEMARSNSSGHSNGYMIEKPGPATARQIACIKAKCEKQNIQLEYLNNKIGQVYNVGSLESLTFIEASEIIKHLSSTGGINEL